MIGQTELEESVNAELQRLIKQLRTLQMESKSFLEYKTKQLKKQNNIISVLEKEHKQLINEISILEEGTHAKRIAQKEKKLMNLQNQETEIQHTLANERINLWELESRIKKKEREVDGLRKLEVPDSCYKDTICKVKKSVVKLENRLDVANKRCSDVLVENTKLRNSINHMLQGRSNFNEMWQSMVSRFNEGKKYIMELIDQSTLAYDQREELCNKLQVLKDRNENDKIIHIQEMREMQRRLEADAKLQQFFDIKTQKRLNPELEQRENNRKLAQKEALERQLAEYKDILDNMQKLYQESDPAKLTAQFKKQEEENFALFSYVNELSREVEILNETTQQLADEIERQKTEVLEKETTQKTEALDYLNQQLEKAELQNGEVKEKLLVLNERIQQMLRGIEELFKQLSCDEAPILNVLSSKTAMTCHNVKLFIGVIEKRMNLLINCLNIEDSTAQILSKKNRIPKFNIKDSVKVQRRNQ